MDGHWQDVTPPPGGRAQLDGDDFLDGTALLDVVGDVGHYHRWSDVSQGGVGEVQDQLELVQGLGQGQRCGAGELERVELERLELEREELEREELEREVWKRAVGYPPDNCGRPCHNGLPVLTRGEFHLEWDGRRDICEALV